MIARTLTAKLLDLIPKFPVITVTGPRQSGKTTLVRAVFTDLPYVSLEEPDIRQFALQDPRGFLANFPQGAVLDEVQRTPELFSYIQTVVDTEERRPYILTGSANFLLLEQISQSLAGRAAVLTLLPFSLMELKQAGYSYDHPESAMFNGQYPPIYDRQIPPTDFFPAYLQTYVERDVRLLKNITDLNAFVQFTQLCAGRVGQLLNLASLANDAGISPNTAKAWLSVLEASYVVYQLRPYHQNFNKRLIKSPKLYFYDVGLVCSLLGIRDVSQLQTHYLKGALFKNLVVGEFIKQAYNRGEHAYPYFWQDSRGNEIDCLLANGDAGIKLVEIKAGKTVTDSYFRNIRYWQNLAGKTATAYVVYGGDRSLQMGDGQLVSWRELEQIYML
ncbi:MAG: ATP-binding protein [Anaerolineae bacterium]|nr:ATP-binding protein [Anaerolineae bacterium]